MHDPRSVRIAALFVMLVPALTHCGDGSLPAEGSDGGGGGGMLCEDTCMYAGDGECDDGAAGSATGVCAYGTDCTDCGARDPMHDMNDDGGSHDAGGINDAGYIPCPLTHGFTCGVGTCAREGFFCIIDPAGPNPNPRCKSIGDCHVITECSDALAHLPATCTDPMCTGDGSTGVTVTCR